MNRIKQIANLVPKTELIYDLACDHGLIGEGLLANGSADRVIFVDRVPRIVARLQKKIASSVSQKERCCVLCADMFSPDDWLRKAEGVGIVLSGVGGHMCSLWANQMMSSGLWESFSWVAFIPHQHPWYLRQTLYSLPGECRRETLLWENAKSYHFLLIDPKGVGPRISLWGTAEWWELDRDDRVFQQFKQMVHAPSVSKKLWPVEMPNQKTLDRICAIKEIIPH